MLADMLAPHRKGKVVKSQPRMSTESAPGQDDGSTPTMTVLPSSTDLFYFYGQSLEQCAKLSTGQALFDLCSLHKKWLRIYAGTADTIFPLQKAANHLFGIEDVLSSDIRR